MTQISYIHGVPANEFSNRGQAATAGPAGLMEVPYLSLTKGEMMVYLLRQRLQLFASFYPEVQEYRQGLTMVNNVLNQGLHRGVNFVGAIPDEIQHVARTIAWAVHQNTPAAGGELLGRSATQIAGIGDIPAQQRYEDCLKNIRADAKPDIKARAIQLCKDKFTVEKIVNGSVVPVSHHVVYQRLNDAYPNIPVRVYTKLLNHQAGIEGMAKLTELSSYLMSVWVDNATIAKNMAVGAGALDGVHTSFALSVNGDNDLAKYQAYLQSIATDRPGATVKGIGTISPQVFQAIVQAIGQAVQAAFAFIQSLRQQKIAEQAMNEAKGFGTTAYSASSNDWPLTQENPTKGQETNKTLTYLALAAGAYFLVNDD